MKNTEKSNENAEKYLGNSESDGDRVSVSKGWAYKRSPKQIKS